MSRRDPVLQAERGAKQNAAVLGFSMKSTAPCFIASMAMGNQVR
jgi:hypothetical protein